MKKKFIFVGLVVLASYIFYCLNVHHVFNQRIDANGLVMNCVSSKVGGIGKRASEVYRFVPPFVSCIIRDMNTERVLNDYWHASDNIFYMNDKVVTHHGDSSRLRKFRTDYKVCEDSYLKLQEMTKSQCENSFNQALKWAITVL